MSYTKSEAPVSAVTRDVPELEVGTTNIYESLVIISKRARQISLDIKEELHGKLEEYATTTDNLEEIFENREQIEISRFYERLPKPAAIAVDEFLTGKVYHRKPSVGTDEAAV